MANSSITANDTEGELIRIEHLQDILVRRESELIYMRDDMQLCKEITRLKRELQKLVSIRDRADGNQQKEEELLWQLHRLVETRDSLVDDVEFEKLREEEEGKELAEFLTSKVSSGLKENSPEGTQLASTPFTPKTGFSLLKECCGFNCSIM